VSKAADHHEYGVGPGGSDTVEVTIGGVSSLQQAYAPAPPKPKPAAPAEPPLPSGKMDLDQLYAFLLRHGPFRYQVWAFAGLPTAAEIVEVAGKTCLFVHPDAWRDAMELFLMDCQSLAKVDGEQAKVPQPLSSPLDPSLRG